MNTTLRLVVLASGDGGNFAAIQNAIAEKQLNAQITALICNRPSAYVLERAKKFGVPAIRLDHSDFASREAFDVALADTIHQHSPDFVVLAGFMRILSPEFVQTFARRLLNIHPSLLPAYPGLNTHQRVLDAGERFHGSSVHFVTEALDAGPVIAQCRFEILEKTNELELKKRVQQGEHKLYPLVLRYFSEGRIDYRGETVYVDNTIGPLILDV